MSTFRIPMADFHTHKRRASETESRDGTARRRRISTTSREQSGNPLKLPTEIWEQIFNHLDLKDIKSVRLSWSPWTNIAARFLFPSFVFKIDRRDIERYEQDVSKDEDFVAGIRSLRFETGMITLHQVQDELAMFFCDSNNSMRSAGSFKDYVSIDAMNEDKATAIAEYAAWNVRWHEAKQSYCDLFRMKSMLGKLKSLDSVGFSIRDTNSSSQLLKKSWCCVPASPTSVNFCRAPKDLFTFLAALASTTLSIKTLYHDRLPVTFFARGDKILAKLAEPLKHLTTLRLTFDASDIPHMKFWASLGHFLKAIPNLAVLRFGFSTNLYNPSVQWYLESYERLAGWYVPLWKMFGNHTWPRLRELRLDGLLVCEDGLFEFMNRHAQTLQVLKLFNLALWSGGMQSLFNRLRASLKLKRFRAWGELNAIHSPHEHWRILSTYDSEDDSTSPEMTAFVAEIWRTAAAVLKQSGDCSQDSAYDRLQEFMVSQNLQRAWPLDNWDLVDEDVKKPLKGWIDFEVQELSGIGEDLFTKLYDEFGFDIDGFDKDGYDEDGDHYAEDVTDSHLITHFAARREILEELLRAIPRYAALAE
ncbi:uncharacterized protein LY89DRAFT_743441 [Mollisia scopiformis]|uniref:F-box domain-containing protein n=1 Tax=Mollisia scopiformis TaxID=149040 RepID=A0A132B4G8_MOLSC|nr:uncharacterized protein LY89DRAFT_743441 [Mollisia scopiformis]KUJ06804.1 hypothetical protein LY89DRAFT_743441 [Mollisia scopiformis]